MKTELRDKLVSLEAGDPVSYEILEEIEKSDTDVEVCSYYTDSAGFIEGWRIGKKGEIVVNTLDYSEPIVRKTQHVEDEV
jgi:hypothetical protein